MDNNKSFVHSLPEKGVLFVGGHQNLTKKLRKKFPKWVFISDEQMKRHTNISQRTIFYWSNHCSHKLMRYVFSKLSKESDVIYVTATNVSLLISEMQLRYNCISCTVD